MRKNKFFESEIDEKSNNQTSMGNDKTQCEIMQRVSFINKLLNQLRHFTTDKIPTHEGFNTSKNHDEQ